MATGKPDAESEEGSGDEEVNENVLTKEFRQARIILKQPSTMMHS